MSYQHMDVKKYKSLISRVFTGANSLIIAFASVLAIVVYFYPPGLSQNPDFYGRWDSAYQYPLKGENVVYRGKVEFIRNGRYNVRGVFEHSGALDGIPYRYAVEAQGSGNWSTTREFLTFTLTDLRMDLKSYSVAGEDVAIADLVKIKGPAFIDFNKKYVPGSSDEYRIISSSKQRMVMEGKDPHGNPFIVTTTRQGSIL